MAKCVTVYFEDDKDADKFVAAFSGRHGLQIIQVFKRTVDLYHDRDMAKAVSETKDIPEPPAEGVDPYKYLRSHMD